MDIRKYFALIFIIFVNLNDSSCSNIPIDYSAMSNLLQSRIKRDDDYKVKCHQSHTGKAELLQLNRTQFHSLGIFVSKKVGNQKN